MSLLLHKDVLIGRIVMIKPRVRSLPDLWPKQWEGDLDLHKDWENRGKETSMKAGA